MLDLPVIFFWVAISMNSEITQCCDGSEHYKLQHYKPLYTHYMKHYKNWSYSTGERAATTGGRFGSDSEMNDRGRMQFEGRGEYKSTRLEAKNYKQPVTR